MKKLGSIYSATQAQKSLQCNQLEWLTVMQERNQISEGPVLHISLIRFSENLIKGDPLPPSQRT